MRKIFASIFCLVLAFCLCGCRTMSDGGSSGSFNGSGITVNGSFNDMSVSGSGMVDNFMPEEGASPGDGAPSGEDKGVAQGRKLIRTADVTGETREYDSFRAWLEDSVASVGGYFETMNERSDDVGRYVEYVGMVRGTERVMECVIRIPADGLDSFVDRLGQNCNVTDTSTSVKDVTLTYVDTESHRDALLVEYDRLMELLEEAGSLDDVLAIEDRLSEVRWQLGSYESQLKVLDDQIDYSTVSLYIREVKEFTDMGGEPEGFFGKLYASFQAGLDDFADGMASFAFWAAGNIAWLVMFVIFGVIVWRLIRKAVRRRRKAAKAGLGSQTYFSPESGGVDSGAVSGPDKGHDDESD